MSEEKIEEFVGKEFIKENIESCKSKAHKNGGPYNKQDRQARRNEVFRLHFEYAYSAVKISDMMKVNRNTINGDIDYWYSQVSKKHAQTDPSHSIAKHIEILEIQKSRLREAIDNTPREHVAIERLLFDIDSKILQIRMKIFESSVTVHDLATKWLNDWMKKHKKDDRYMTWLDVIKVSQKAQDKINKIIKDDRKN